MSHSEDATLTPTAPPAGGGGDAPTVDPPSTQSSHRRRPRRGGNLTAAGEPLQWLTGGALVISLVMVAGLLGLILVQGLKTFWPQPVVRLQTHDGRTVFGEPFRDEEFELSKELYAQLPEETRSAAGAPFGGRDPETLDEFAAHRALRREIRTGNFELTETHFTWVSEFEIASEDRPEWALVIERLTNGRFYGEPCPSCASSRGTKRTIRPS